VKEAFLELFSEKQTYQTVIVPAPISATLILQAPI